MSDIFDIVVIGGGHAGVEAAWAACHMLGASGRVAMVTMDPLAIGRMSCNPAIGGIAKGQMVREIDALGGLMAHAIDATGIQFRMLNASKGPAVQSPRAQADKYAYARVVQQLLATHCPNLTIVTGIVDRLHYQPVTDTASEARQQITGVTLEDGRFFACRAVVATTGTFLRGLMHCGECQTEGGRVGEAAAKGLSASFAELGLQVGRLKTGTPPRLAAESLRLVDLALQHGDDHPQPFSDLTGTPDALVARQFPCLPQVPCYITYTNAAVHDCIRANLHRAPMYSGQIHSRGPRYCPSIEDKIVRFADKDRHQIFLEPESLESNEIYCNGISTSLPQDVQDTLIHSIEGLENARVLRYGYAVEYDFIPSHQLDASLEVRTVRGLWLAGQINGTSGYEEAAGQGLIAGINAARRIQSRPAVVLSRAQAYIGVMIDDLVTKELTEPYRMFTSRAEFRLSLRSDNTDQRLTPLGYEIGLATTARYQRYHRRLLAQQDLEQKLGQLHNAHGSALDYLRRPEVTLANLAEVFGGTAGAQLAAYLGDPVLASVAGQVEVQAKYAGYIERERRSAERMLQLEAKTIPAGMNYANFRDLRNEARQALEKFRPRTIGQAARLEGLTPADVSILLVHMGR